MAQQQPAISLNHLHRDPASGGLPPGVSCSTETALEIDETESVAREDLVDFFKEDRLRMNMCLPLPVEDLPPGLKDDSLDKERHRHEQMLLMALRNGCNFLDEKLEVIKGLEAWLDRIYDEIHKVAIFKSSHLPAIYRSWIQNAHHLVDFKGPEVERAL